MTLSEATTLYNIIIFLFAYLFCLFVTFLTGRCGHFVFFAFFSSHFTCYWPAKMTCFSFLVGYPKNQFFIETRNATCLSFERENVEWPIVVACRGILKVPRWGVVMCTITTHCTHSTSFLMLKMVFFVVKDQFVLIEAFVFLRMFYGIF